MHSAPPPVVLVHVVGIVTLVLLGLMFVGTIVGTVLFLSGRQGSGVRRVGRAIGLGMGIPFAALIVVGVFFAGFARVSQQAAVRQSTVERLRQLGEELHRQNAQPQPPAQPIPPQSSSEAVAPADASHALIPQDDLSISSQNGGDKLPEWTARLEDTEGDVMRIVLSSQQYATADEARSQIAALAKDRLKQDFERIYGVTSKHIDNLTAETLKSLAIRQEFVETVQRDFGNFFAPMHRVWWQLELSPLVRTNLHQSWRAEQQETRTLMVIGGVIATTLGFAGLSGFSRRRKDSPATPVTAPPSSKSASAAVLGVGAATLAAQKCRRWWRR